VSPISRLAGRVRALALACTAAAGAAVAGEVRAEEPTSTQTQTQTATSTPTEDIVVVGTRRRRTQAAQDPTAAATIIEADRFAGEAKGVADLVATAPGVAVDDYGGLGHLATVSIRGSTASGVLVLLDGMPLNTGLGGGVDLSSIPRSWIDRIEIVRGAEGAHYGSGSLGGVVNVITRRRPAGTWSGEASAGSFDTFAASAEGAAGTASTSLFVSGACEATSGEFPYLWASTPNGPSDQAWLASRRTGNGASRAGFMAKLGTPLGDARLDAVAQLSAGRRELPGWPYHLTPGDAQEDARALLSARVSGTGPGPDLLVAGRASLRLDWLSTQLGGNDSTQRGGALGIHGEARLGHGPGVLRLSAEAEGEAFQGTGLDGTVGRPTFAATASEDLGLAGDRARISPAVRVERVGPFGGVSGKLGGSFRVAGPVALRASAGRTFRAPSFAELHLQQGLADPNPDLVPEEGVGADGGLVVDAAPVYATLGAHATLYRDLIYYQRASLERLKPFNAGKVLVRGLEAELATAPARALLGLSLSASYTLLFTEILRGTEGTLGNEVPHRARHRLYARAALAPGPAGLHVEAQYVGRQWEDDANLAPIPAALLWGAGGSVRLLRAPSVHLSLEIRNLLDDRSQQDGFGNPLPGRMVLLAVRAGSSPREGTP
jgi:iron complex outermembrane receptor protein